MTEPSAPVHRPRRWIIHVTILAAIGALLVFNAIRASHLRRLQGIPVFGSVPEFHLTERGGQTVTRDDLKGNVWIADFIFTHCAGPCPLMTRQMAKAQSALRDMPDARLVSFTVDPGRDTPPVLADYAKKFDADPSRWFFLTGPKPALYDLANKGFKVGATENTGPDRLADEDEVLHSTSFVLVDRDGNIRGYYDGLEAPGFEKLLQDARALLGR